MSQQAPEPETIDLSPSKDTYQSIQSDVTPVSAIKELIDNAIDNWQRVHNQQTDLEIEIEYDTENDIFRITDNSGGLEEGKIAKLFALGDSTKEEITTAIGSYGIGAKKAIVKLGREAELKSRFKDQESGYGFEIEEDWLNDPKNWRVQKQTYPDLPAGTTVIEIRDLKLELEEVEEELDEVKVDQGSIGLESFVNGLRDNLSITYELFLKQSNFFDGSISISLNGKPVPKPQEIGWSFTPFDGFHPRSYDKITLRRHDLDEDIHLTIRVGLMTSRHQGRAGTDIFCQNRKVISGNTGSVGGYNNVHADSIGELGPAQGRLKVRMFFETEGDADRLPWDTKKNSVDEFDSLMQEAYDWFNRIVQPYWKASRYDTFPRAFIEPYPRDSAEAYNQGRIQHHSYQNQQRHTKRPNEDFEERDSLQETYELHVSLGVSAIQFVRDLYRPTYTSLIESESSENVDGEAVDEPIELTDIPGNFSEAEFKHTIQSVIEQAEVDGKNSQRRDVDGEWWDEIYYSHLEFHSPEDLGSLPEVGGEIAPGISDTQEPSLDSETEADPSRGDLERTSEDESAGRDESSAGSQATDNRENEDPSYTQASLVPGEMGLGSATGHIFGDDGSNSIVLSFNSKQWEDLCGFFELRTDVDTSVVEERVQERILTSWLDVENE